MSSAPGPPTSQRRRMPHLGPWAAVLGGGLVGSFARVVIGRYLSAGPGSFPVATLVVNLLGSMLIGFYLTRRQQTVTSARSLQFWGIGVFGSLTTFSTFSLEVFELLGRGEAPSAALYLTASIVGGLACALVGQRLASVVR